MYFVKHFGFNCQLNKYDFWTKYFIMLKMVIQKPQEKSSNSLFPEFIGENILK